MKPSTATSPDLAPEGHERLAWARRNMPVLRGLEEEFARTQPLAGRNVVVSVHLEAKTAYLALVLCAGGARVAVTGSNAGSTKDSVVAALVERGLHVYARHGASPEEMHQFLHDALDLEPQVVIDDGGDIVEVLHDERAELLPQVLGACEETTTGVLRARARSRAGKLAFPVLLINDARCKHLFDNVYGTGESVWAAVMRAGNVAVAGKTVAIAGFGWCGRGCALRASGLGARVIVSEVDPVKALDATMNGYQVLPLVEACRQADFVLTVTGLRNTLRREHFEAMKNGAFIANAGHFRSEVDVPALEDLGVERSRERETIEGFRMSDDRWLYLLGNGNIVNIACGDGHPAEIMDLSFSLQALTARYVTEQAGTLARDTLPVPEAIDLEVARRKLESMGVSIDDLSAEQEAYRDHWRTDV